MKLLRIGVDALDYVEAISEAGSLLVNAGLTEERYTSAMIRVVDELGPYMVLADQVALAHARPTDGVLENGISLALLSKTIDFAGKPVRAVFALAATNHDAHLENLSALADALADERTRNLLLTALELEQIPTVFKAILGE